MVFCTRYWFPLVVVATFALFMGTMVFVIIVTHNRSTSGVTKIDMGEMQKIRHTYSPSS